MFRFPFGTMHELNLDWFLQEWEIYKQEWADAQAGIDNALQGEVDRVEDAMTDLYNARDAAVQAKDDAQTAAGSALSDAGQAGTDALKSEGFAVGEQDGIPVGSGSPYYQQNAKYYKVEAGTYRYLSEAYAKGEMGGSPVAPGEAGYQDNAKYYKDATASDRIQTGLDAAATAADALTAEGNAVGEQNGTPVSSGSPYYENNAKYYSQQTAQDKADTDTLKDAANAAALRAEGYSSGTQNGTPVSSGSPYYENNGAYYLQRTTNVANTVPLDYSEMSQDVVMLKTATDFSIIPLINGSYIVSNGDTVDWQNPTAGTEINNYAVVDAAPGEKFTLNGNGGSTGRLWCFVDASGNNLACADASISGENLIITAPENSTKLIINMLREYGIVCRGVYLPNRLANLNYSCKSLDREILDASNCEQGSIYSSNGTNYNGITNYVRLKTYQYFPAGTTFMCKPGYRFRLFEYSSRGSYIGNSDWYSIAHPVTIQQAGYYRFIFGKYPESTTTVADAENFIVGNELAVRLYNIITDNQIAQLSTPTDEGVFNLKKQKRAFYSDGYSLPSTSIHAGLTSRQGMAIHHGKVVILFSDNYAAVIDKSTGAAVGDFSIDCGHGNSCQFAKNQFHTVGDDYPLLYCFDYIDPYVYVNRITDTSATLIKTYDLDQMPGYRFSGGVNEDGTILYCISYAINSSTNSTNNYCYISSYDLTSTTMANGRYRPALIETVKIPFIYVIQDVCYHNGELYIATGDGSGSGFNGIYRVSVSGEITGKIKYTIDSNEPEGIDIYDNPDNAESYEMYFCTNKLYSVELGSH